jgi:hypothetical protein
MARLVLAGCFLLLLVYVFAAQNGGVEAIEVGKDRTDLLPTGKEADGIIGDFVLRNKRIHALISANLPQRRANMAMDWEFVTPGCLYDLDLRGASNDQITLFQPGEQIGAVSYVRIVSDGRDGAAVVETVRTAALGDGLFTRHEYRLESGWQHLVITSTYRNESNAAKKITPLPIWKEFSQQWQIGDIHVGDSIDPFDKRAYAWGPLPQPGESSAEREAQLQTGEQRTYTVALAVADSPLAAYGKLASLRSAAGDVAGTAKDSGSRPALHASLLVNVRGSSLPSYPDAAGNFAFQLPEGHYKAKLLDIGREPSSETEKAFSVVRGETKRLVINAPVASAVSFDIRDEAGQPAPCKIQFIGKDGTPTPDLGTDYRARGCNHQYHSHDGQFTQQIPPGKYVLRITRGPEHDLIERAIEVGRSQTLNVAGILKRTVDTRGWISSDFHSHSTPSGDNYCNTNDRIISHVAEHIEFAPTTEHNRIYDWQPHIDRLGVGKHLKTISGIELTGDGPHLNSFPLKPSFYTQDGGAPVWQFDPRLNAIVLRNAAGGGSDRWVQLNHPTVGTVFNDRNQDQIADGGFKGIEHLIDAAEFWSTEILNTNPWYLWRQGDRVEKLENRTLGWLQLLNQGHLIWCIAVSDAHRVFNEGVGGWRTYVASSTDEPGAIDYQEIIRNSKAGRMMITNGPFLQVTVGDGSPIGSTVTAEKLVSLKVKVQTPNWFDIDRVQVLVNGGQHKDYNYSRETHPDKFKDDVVKFNQTLQVKLREDAHLIVVAIGEKSNLSKGWGQSWAAAMHPLAFTNPIYVDVDHNGFKANGDTLGHPLLVTPKFE